MSRGTGFSTKVKSMYNVITMYLFDQETNYQLFKNYSPLLNFADHPKLYQSLIILHKFSDSEFNSDFIDQVSISELMRCMTCLEKGERYTIPEPPAFPQCFELTVPPCDQRVESESSDSVLHSTELATYNTKRSENDVEWLSEYLMQGAQVKCERTQMFHCSPELLDFTYQRFLTSSTVWQLKSFRFEVLVYAPPASGKSVFANDFCSDTDFMFSWDTIHPVVVTNLPRLISWAKWSIAVIPSRRVFEQRCRARKLIPGLRWYDDILRAAGDADWVVVSDLYVQQVILRHFQTFPAYVKTRFKEAGIYSAPGVVANGELPR